jgi:DNA-directed RNA polymerase subunit D
MKLELIKKKKGKVTFEIKDESVAYVNTLRRIFTTEVPTMAIATVEFRQNSSALYDEIIAHRLGLLVLKTDLDSYNMLNEGETDSAATSVTFTLKAVGPKTIYASDLKSSDSKTVPVYPETILLKLFDKQEIEFIATARLGIGKNHRKWILVWHHITINQK